jgi:hypothetical protein
MEHKKRKGIALCAFSTDSFLSTKLLPKLGSIALG